MMDARKEAARFAAYAWYEDVRAGRGSPDEAARFAAESWPAFLPGAHAGWGELLLRIAPGGRLRRPCLEAVGS